MTESRGTRPKAPERWPRRAEGIRKETEQLGEEIARLSDEARKCLHNRYELEVILADLGRMGEQVRRLMIQAQQGVDLGTGS